MDPIAFLAETDPLRRGVMQAVAWATRDLQQQADRNRAIMHASEIAQVLNRMFK
jgi:hypothetical protein